MNMDFLSSSYSAIYWYTDIAKCQFGSHQVDLPVRRTSKLRLRLPNNQLSVVKPKFISSSPCAVLSAARETINPPMLLRLAEDTKTNGRMQELIIFIRRRTEFRCRTDRCEHCLRR